MSKALEDRFHNYARAVRDYCTKIKWDVINKEYIKQVIRSSGSISANYTEASDDPGKGRRNNEVENFKAGSKGNNQVAGPHPEIRREAFGAIEGTACQ